MKKKYKYNSKNQEKKLSRTESTKIRPKRVALIARDFILEKKNGAHRFRSSKTGFDPFFSNISEACSDKGCDTLLFSLWSHKESKSNKIKRSQIFPKGTSHKVAILEAKRNGCDYIQLWLRDQKAPMEFIQFFGKSSDSKVNRESFISDFNNRTYGPTFLIFCGETNIIRTTRNSKKIIDEFKFINELKKNSIKFLLNPIHNYMVRYEMKMKRACLSQNRKYIFSVWNRGMKKANESYYPWTVFYNGENLTDKIIEMPCPIPEQPGVRIGIFNLN